MGTGVIIDPRGYIITNHHVVDGVRRIQVTLSDRRAFVARLVCHDPLTDLAIIKITTDEKLPLIRVGTSTDLMTGEPVIAVGNAYGYHHTATRGIISALGRSVQVTEAQKYHDLIQTDASINPGNSGGPLLNIDGEMIGINVAVRVGAQGIGFAIPVDRAMSVAAELMRTKGVSGVSHGIIGGTASRGGERTFVVHSVQKGSPAAVSGVRSGDVIRRIGSMEIERGLDLERAFLGRRPGQKVKIALERDRRPSELTIQLGQIRPRRTSKPSVENLVWSQLGLRLTPVPEKSLRMTTSDYDGGLRVTAIKPDGPADQQGIRSGDVLVGMHKWETVSLDNVQFILNHPDLRTTEPVKFYIVRRGETLFGHLPVIRR